MFHFNPIRDLGTNSCHVQSHIKVEGMHIMGCCMMPTEVLLVALLSPPQYRIALGIIPHTLALVNPSAVLCPETLPLSATRMPSVGFWRGQDRVTIHTLLLL